ncbi:pre-mRNA processing RNA-helicase [Rhizina undulata]
MIAMIRDLREGIEVEAETWRRDYRDRDRGDRDHRRDRSIDRRRRDEYYDSWDDRTRLRDERDRLRERDRSPRSPRRDRERDRDNDRDRDRRRSSRSGDRSRDRSRDRTRRDRDRERGRDGRRDRDDSRGFRAKDSPAPAPITEEEKIRQRKERLEAWKKKRAEEEEAKKNAASPAAILSSLERQPVPAVPVPVPVPSAPITSPKPTQTPESATAATNTTSNSPAALPKADKLKPVAISSSIVPPKGTALPTNRPISTFGFGAANRKTAPEKRKLGFGDEESSRKKLERLPSPVPDDGRENDGQEDDDDTVMQESTEEEAAAAARAAAAQRSERTQDPDSMQIDSESKVDEGQPQEDDEEADPLDAFMVGIGKSLTATANEISKIKEPQKEEEALFGDDDVDYVPTEADPDDILAMAAKLKKKKELPTIDHSKVKYDEFRKNFYMEPAELAEMTEQEVDDLRLFLDGIKIRGQDCPKPVQKWSQCGLPAQTLSVIQQLNYDKPTSIQAQAIPAIMSGRNVIGVAKTGSGKTIAFLLPMFRHIKDQRILDPQEGPISLIMTPTRELAVQIYKECKPFLKALNLRAVCAYGGSPIKDQIADLKRGAEIIVCTPGRMIDLLAANSGRVTNLKRVTYVVLDEADRMFDMGFEPQVMKIIGNIRPDRQTVLFSATFPRQMEALARKVLHRPVEIVVGARSVVAPEVAQIVEVRTDDTKFHRTLELLGELYDKDDDARTLIFVDRQEAADTLLRDIMRRGYPCMSIHGGKDQIDRDSTISDFKNGVFPVLVATSVAARGLDVKQLKLVINYDCPNHMEDYVHRVGRTGRAGNTGTAVTFITEEQDRYAVDIAKALKQSGQKVPEEVQKLVDGFNEKVKAGKEKASGSGFGGKGLERLDQERDLARRRERKQYGEEGAEEGEEVIEADAEATPTSATVKKPPTGPASSDDKIVVHKRGIANNDALDRVKQATSAIHSRLNKTGQLRSGVPIDNKGPDAGAYHATLEINDFPQKARWAVTNRTNIAKVLEATGTSITTKGSFYPPGKAPQPGQDPKLYILVEGDTELVVTNAMRELKRLLAEGTAAAVDSESRAPASSRYSVI